MPRHICLLLFLYNKIFPFSMLTELFSDIWNRHHSLHCTHWGLHLTGKNTWFRGSYFLSPSPHSVMGKPVFHLLFVFLLLPPFHSFKLGYVLLHCTFMFTVQELQPPHQLSNHCFCSNLPASSSSEGMGAFNLARARQKKQSEHSHIYFLWVGERER